MRINPTRFLFCVAFMLSSQQLFAQNFNFTFRDQLTYTVPLSNLWGYAAAGNEYALVGTYNNLSIVNVTDPDNIVELFAVPHDGSAWCEIKVWDQHAYVVNEEGGGVLIVDLSQLPLNETHSYFTAGGIETSHTIWIDENGIMYLWGNNVNDGASVYDLNIDPLNPQLIGEHSGPYIHDGFVRGDTLWASQIYDGQLAIYDVTDKDNFQQLGIQTTPLAFAHNAWPTSDNHYVFTTDEKPNSTLTSYDVSDLSNIIELDQVQSSPGSNVIIHNAHLVNNDFCAASYYKDGAVLVDVSEPDNMVIVGSYDTSPLSGDGFNGAWGVYPYLPSGNWLVTDIEEGLFVLSPQYVIAARLEGIVTDSITNLPINNVSVNITTTTISEQTNLSGEYKTGIANGGTYQIDFIVSGYQPRSIVVNLVNDSIITRNIKLFPLPSFPIVIEAVDETSGDVINDAKAFLTDYGLYQYSTSTNASGFGQIASAYASDYDMVIGAWGYKTKLISVGTVNTGDTIIALLERGYYDDFYFDFGWMQSQTSTSGHFERSVPVATSFDGETVDPGSDMTGDFGSQAYVTGNAGGDAADDDVDGGYSLLTSPVFDLTDYDEPYVHYSRWFQNTGGTGASPNDSMIVSLTNGLTTVNIETITHTSAPLGEWVNRSYRIEDILTPTANMQFQVRVVDASPGHLVEGALDLFFIADSLADNITDVTSTNPIRVYPNPTTNKLYIQQSTHESGYYKVISVNGALLYESALSASGSTEINTSSLPNGAYIIEVTTSQNRCFASFVKQ